MLIAAAGLAGLLAGLAAGGSMVGLAELRFRWPWVVAVALILKEAGVFGPLAHSQLTPALYTASLAGLVAWTLWHRKRLSGLALVAAGLCLNLAVVSANGGRMPVSPGLAAGGPAQLRLEGHLGQYVVAGAGTHLAGLADWISPPGRLHALLPFAYSPGDLVAAGGMLLTGLQGVRRRPPATL